MVRVKQRIATAMAVGTGETGVKVNGNKHWFWTWKNLHLPYIIHSNTRGKSAIEVNFSKGFINATIVHDGWRAQITTKAKHHQTCLPHLLRHLNYLNQKYNNTQWSQSFQKLLYDAINIFKDQGNKQQNIETPKTVQRQEKLLEKLPNKDQKELYTFYKRMCHQTITDRKELFVT